MSESLLLSLLACGLLATSSIHFVALGVARHSQATRAQVHRRRNLTRLRQAAEIARLNSELRSKASGNGLPWRVLEVAEVVEESADCRSYYLVDPHGQALPAFQPGQHVLVRPALAGSNPLTRCYSLSAAPDPRFWRLTVKRQASVAPLRAAGQQGGLSHWLHEAVGAGDCLLVGGPIGHFCLTAENRRPLVLVAAGVGVTPLASMLLWSRKHTPDRSLALLYQAQDADHWPLGRSLHQFAVPGHYHVTSYFSRVDAQAAGAVACDSAGQPLPGECRAGKFTGREVAAALPDPDCDYFLCGPSGWMDRIRDELLAEGIAPQQIHWEAFGGSAEGVSKPATNGDGESRCVQFERSRVTAEHRDPAQTLWELAREQDVDIPSGCLTGVCGTCRVRVLAGEVEYDSPLGLELAAGECLPCIAKPKTAVAIDA